MNDKEILAQTFVKLTKEYRIAQKNPTNFASINKISKKIRITFKKIQAIGDPAREELYKQMVCQPIDISSFIAAYLLRYRTNESMQILEEASQLSGDIGYSSQQTILRWKEKDWHLDE